MSQEYKDFDEEYSIRAEKIETKSGPSYNASANVPGQKLSSYPNFALPSPRQRLILAIVSLGVWMVLFSLSLVIITSTPSFISVPSTFPGGFPTVIDNPVFHILYFLFGFGLSIFGIIIVTINILFNRKR